MPRRRAGRRRSASHREGRLAVTAERAILMAMGFRSPTRASDEERERAAASLRAHYTEGRLSAAELEQRAHTAYRATHRGELAALFADLPSERRGGFSPEALRLRARRLHRALLRGHVATYVLVNTFLVAVWMLAGQGLFWPALYLVPSTALLAWHWTATRVLARALARRPAELIPGARLLVQVMSISRRART